MFEHDIGVDLHQAFFQACAVTASGDRAWEGRFPRSDAGIAALLARCDRRTAVAVEASTPTWHFSVPNAGACRQLCRSRASRRGKRRPCAARSHHTPRLALVAMGTDRSGDAWDAADRPHWPLGPPAGHPERCTQSARRPCADVV